jgi:hypothetical protein
MTSVRTALVSFVCLLAAASCGSNTSDNSYKDSLTFGTGIGGNGFDLVGEGTTFSIGIMGTQGTIYFKLESAADMGARAGRIYINDGTYGMEDYPSLQSYGHYLLSTFRITDTGTFTVKGYLVEQVGPDIGKETFVAGSTITTTP